MKVLLNLMEMNLLSDEELLDRLEYAIKNNLYHDYIVDNLKDAVLNRMKSKLSRPQKDNVKGIVINGRT